MKKNFTIEQSSELVRGSRIFDLHNRYDFSELRIRPNSTAMIAFHPNSEYGSEEPPLILEFLEIDYLELSPGFGTNLIADLDEIGYMGPHQRDDVWLLDEQQATESDHILFRLSPAFIRIHARQARLHVLDVGSAPKIRQFFLE